MTNIPDFKIETTKFMKENVIRETHYAHLFEDAMRTGYDLALKEVVKQIKDVDEQITNKRKNNISC